MIVNKQMVVRERVKIVNKDNTVTNAEGKSVAFAYKVRSNESGEDVVRHDGVYAVDSLGGIICGETGYISGQPIKTIAAFLKDGHIGKGTTSSEFGGQEVVYMVPVFLDRYQQNVYVQTSNIDYI